MFSQVPIYALNQTDRITSPLRLKRLIVTPVWVPLLIRYRKSEKCLNVNDKTTASYPTICLPGLSNVANHYNAHTRSTGSLSLKYEHRHCWVTFEIQRKYRNLYREKAYRSCNLRKWKDFNKKNSFPYLKCVSRLSCVVHWPIYTATHKTASINRPVDHTRDVTHILSKVSCFYWNPFIFVRYRNDRFFSYTNSYISAVFRVLRSNTDDHISSLGYLC